ncbi:MAG: patatin-like phospholipase family protein [Gemmatimonadales bacterium]
MHRPCRTLLLVASLLLGLGSPASGQTCPAGPLALVLSGGGAKGLAHIGVLRVLDSLGIHPDLVIGTSMGAIVGAMYASGYAGRDIDSLTRSLPLGGLFRKYEPRTPHSLGARLPLVVWEQGDGSFTLQRAAVRESEVNGLINAAMLRGNLRARGNFDSLPIPFRAIATDLLGRDEVILRAGDLARAVRASMSIPLIFEPERLDGRDLGDGALVANVPVEAARREGAMRVIVSDATEHFADTVNLRSPIALAERLLGFLFNQPRALLGPADRYIRPDVDGFASLDFSGATISTLIARGYDAARETLQGDTCARSPRLPLPPAPRLRIAHITSHGGSPAEQAFVRQLLRVEEGDSIDPAATRAGFRLLETNDGIAAAWLQPTGPADSVELNLEVRPANRRLTALGITYDNDLGGRMWVGASDRRLANRRLEGSAVLGLGELRQDLELGLRTYTLTHQPLRPAVVLTLARERVRSFDSIGDEIPGVKIREAVGFVGLEQEIGGEVSLSIGGRLHIWHEAARGDRTTLGGVVRLQRDVRHGATHLLAEAAVLGAYKRFAAELFTPMRINRRFRLTPWLRYGWASGRVPLQSTFMLGGYDGFPGLHVGERRGTREALGGLSAAVTLVGPLELQFEGAFGQVATGGSAFPTSTWEYGGRIGLGAKTPVGPIRVEYSRARRDRDMMFVRLGEWF